MHASVEQLLSLRDGAPVDAIVRDHVRQCAKCLAEAAALSRVRNQLQSLPALEPASDLWPSIEARMQQTPKRSYAFAAAAALALVVASSIVVVAFRNADAPSDSVALLPATPSDVPARELSDLIAQSRELEELLGELPERPQVERVSTAATVDSLEQRIQWLDWQLAYQSDGGLDERQAERLWSERVDLMDSLVKVRYAQSAPMLF